MHVAFFTPQLQSTRFWNQFQCLLRDSIDVARPAWTKPRSRWVSQGRVANVAQQTGHFTLTYIHQNQPKTAKHAFVQRRVVAVPFCSTKGLQPNGGNRATTATHPIRPMQPSPWLTLPDQRAGPVLASELSTPVPVVIPDCLGGWRYPNCHVKIPSPSRHTVQTTDEAWESWIETLPAPHLKTVTQWYKRRFHGQLTFTMSVTRWKFVSNPLKIRWNKFSFSDVFTCSSNHATKTSGGAL